CMLGLEFPHSF
nr:immunoglobulin light chain junction region [Macaca mulatta]